MSTALGAYKAWVCQHPGIVSNLDWLLYLTVWNPARTNGESSEVAYEAYHAVVGLLSVFHQHILEEADLPAPKPAAAIWLDMLEQVEVIYELRAMHLENMGKMSRYGPLTVLEVVKSCLKMMCWSQHSGHLFLSKPSSEDMDLIASEQGLQGDVRSKDQAPPSACPDWVDEDDSQGLEAQRVEPDVAGRDAACMATCHVLQLASQCLLHAARQAAAAAGSCSHWPATPQPAPGPWAKARHSQPARRWQQHAEGRGVGRPGTRGRDGREHRRQHVAAQPGSGQGPCSPALDTRRGRRAGRAQAPAAAVPRSRQQLFSYALPGCPWSEP
ncbi:peroxisomal membrane protein PEX16, partial [Haematococcus lacustris]